MHNGTATGFADKLQMQHRLFAALSAMFGREVPLYDKSLLVNRACNRTVCDLLSGLHRGLAISDEELEKTSGERHGAIRIGRDDEYRLITRFFAAFAMEPHNFYDMAGVGAKSQPIIATAFRSRLNPEHRVFTSLLRTDYFDAATKARLEAALAQRRVFSDRAVALLDKSERQGGLSHADADELINEATTRIFKWTGTARDHGLYTDLCNGGFKIAADIACFHNHHLNHLTPNTLCMDLFTAAMKHCLGEMDAATFTARATLTLGRLAARADGHWLRLHFRHLTWEAIGRFQRGSLLATGPGSIPARAAELLARLNEPGLRLAGLKHAGYKDFTEGPSEDTPVLLRQDAYKALTEPVVFTNPDGTTLNTTHTARFGEIEERFYATTPTGRALYDRCLSEADSARDKDPGLPRRDMAAYEALYARPFAPFPKTVPELISRGLIFARYAPTAAGLAARGRITPGDVHALVRAGYATAEGLRYEDFLPVSAAGIFASNLGQYGTKSTAAVRPVYTQAQLEAVMGRPVIDTDTAYAQMERDSIRETLAALGVAAEARAAA